jgi:hypothetical protein
MRYINGEEIKVGDIVCYITSTCERLTRSCLTGGTIIAIGTEQVIINDCGNTVTRFPDQIYPM